MDLFCKSTQNFLLYFFWKKTKHSVPSSIYSISTLLNPFKLNENVFVYKKCLYCYKNLSPADENSSYIRLHINP